MADFTVNIAGDGTPSDISTIGEKLYDLARKLPELAQVSKVKVHRTGDLEKYRDQAKTWSAEATGIAEEIFDSLSVTVYDDNGNEQRKIAHTERPEDKKIHDVVELVFVFEDDGHMVVPVPNAKQIARGISRAPLKLPEVYDGLQASSVAEFFVENLAIRAQEPGSALNALATQHGGLFHAVIDALRDIAAAAENSADAKSTEVFYQQLGDYSVRQCGH